jgi:L-methionine (R)-S-oxide reductase
MGNETTPALSRQEKYEKLLPQLAFLVQGEDDIIANLANISAAIKQELEFAWVGFYLAKKGELVLGPFQGHVACTRIPFGHGVCGKAYAENQTINVGNVNLFPDYIDCHDDTKSEIVVPISLDGEVVMVMDIDSVNYNDFNQTDEIFLKRIAAIIEQCL